MKKIFSFLLFFSILVVRSQCPTGTVTLASQSDVNNFAISYPSCNTITGNLYIGTSVFTANNITDLSPLSNISTILGELYIINCDNLFSLQGLNNVTSIGQELVVQNNYNLVDFTGLSSLSSIGEFFTIAFNDNMIDLDGLQNLTNVDEVISIGNNNNMISLNGLQSLTTTNDDINIISLPDLIDITGLANLNNVNGDLNIQATNLNSLSGLDGLSSISGNLLIGYNSNLTNITALHHNISIGDLTIVGNTLLSECSVQAVCDFLDFNSATINNNSVGCNSEIEVENICSVPQTKLSSTWCNSQLTTFSQTFSAISVPGATQYEFEFTDINTNVITTNIRPTINNTLVLAGLMSLGKIYEVRVRAYVGGTWGMYGDVCLLNSPVTVPLTKLATVSCGATVPTFNTTISAVAVSGATQYEFKFTNISTSVVTTNVRPSYTNTLQLAGLWDIGATYDVQVRAYLDGTWGNYGDICQLNSPTSVPPTKLATTSCGVTVPTFNTTISAVAVAGATQYEFKFTNLSTSVVTTNIRPTNTNTLQLAGLMDIGASYDVEVRAYMNGIWGTYGVVCQLHAPATVPLSKLAPVSCGATLNYFNSTISAVPVAGATQYEFMFTDINTSVVTSNIRPTYTNTLQLAGLMVVGASYNVQVRAYMNGIWGSYGDICLLNSPPNVPLTNLITSSCGVQLISYTQTFSAFGVVGATHYEFEFTNLNTSAVTTNIVSSPSNNLTLAGLLTPAVTYNVRVRAMFNGVWGNFGAVCQLHSPLTPPSNILNEDDPNTPPTENQTVSINEDFVPKINVYPNPTADFVNVQCDLLNYSVHLYDLNGKLIFTEENINGNLTLDVSFLNSGIYQLVIFSDEKLSLKSEKLIVAKR